MNSKKFQWTVTSLISAASLFISGIATVNAETYEVKSGDTLSKIALENNTSLENIISTNNLTNEDLIYAGQIIELGERSKSMVDKVAPQEQAKIAENTPTETVVAPQATQKQTTYGANATVASVQSTNGGIVLSNGNTAGEQGAYAASRMAEMTGVPASTWEAIIARESNGQVNAANASGASGLFQTMPGWGSTATVDDQIQAAYNAYNSQGLSAWGY
ncbi:LysM peptidoglycan-binding domain-containing protein [Streptococcus parasanguinis]|uniref:LysM peptidoglycan-binding domain-containing protein n=1 Tax=Streptococcus parasanguinis TaxID=1318 RepID=UPI001BEAA952|nr:LysM peptidoglycan-binding domain-containing protein [Streptococcus parasanguinis]MBT3138154.1 LysM peptidoglycan-binding domain-containing protein [Streptococcus parasanguinis]